MAKIKDIPKVERPREKLLKKGANALSKYVYFQLQTCSHFGKYKLLGFIEDIVSQKSGEVKSFCDLVAGTGGVVRFNNLKAVR